MWGLSLRSQLLGVTVATLLLLTVTWSEWDPGTTFRQSSTVLVSNPFDAVFSDASGSPRIPEEKYKVAEENQQENVSFKQTWNRTERKLIDIPGNESAVANQQTPKSVSAEDQLVLKEKIRSWRQKMQRKLRAAKKSIAKASSTKNGDKSLQPDLYHNVAAFSKSYELMEKIFRIYVYKEGSKPLVHSGPLTGIYASEGQFIAHMQMSNNSFVVRDPWRAQMFFMPYSVKNLEAQLYIPDSQSMRPITDFVNNYVDLIQSRHPFWNVTRGSDHFFVSCHDWGPLSALEHKELLENAVKVVCNADKSSETYPYVLGRDVSLPEINIHYLVQPDYIGGPGADERPTLAFFAGQMHGHVRPILVKHWQHDPDMKVMEVLENEMKKPDYIQNMRSSKYCLCAQGFEVNSPRIVEAIYQDCVPVILADHIDLPFSDVLNWDKFSVTVREAEIPNLKKILTEIPDKKYRAMQGSLKSVRRHFLWNNQLNVKYDVFHMILHSIWLSRLQQIDANPVIEQKSEAQVL